MARILIVYKEFPGASVGHAGGRAVFRLVESLHRRGHRVFLVARLRREEGALVAQTASLCQRVVTVPHHQALSGPRPLAFARSYLALRRAAARALREVQPDLLHVEVTQTAVALLGLRRPLSSIRPLDVNWFLLRQGAVHLRGARRWSAQLASWLLAWVEPWIYRRYDLITAVSEGDRRLLAPRCEPRPAVLLPLVPAEVSGAAERPPASPGPNVLFVGAMYRTFNAEGVLWFLRHVWPNVVDRVPQARFYVVGHQPTEAVRAWHDGEHVFVTGYVDDLAGCYRAAAVFVSPLLVAGGLLQKVVDALAMGIPVVATSVSNHGLGGIPGQHLLVADDPRTFSDAVVRLLESPTEREQLGQAGQRFVRDQYDFETAVTRWEGMWSTRC